MYIKIIYSVCVCVCACACACACVCVSTLKNLELFKFNKIKSILFNNCVLSCLNYWHTPHIFSSSGSGSRSSTR